MMTTKWKDQSVAEQWRIDPPILPAVLLLEAQAVTKKMTEEAKMPLSNLEAHCEGTIRCNNQGPEARLILI